MKERKNLSDFLFKLAELVKKHDVTMNYNVNDDGIHFKSKGAEVAIMDPTSTDLFNEACELARNKQDC